MQCGCSRCNKNEQLPYGYELRKNKEGYRLIYNPAKFIV